MSILNPYEQVTILLHTDGKWYWVSAHYQVSPSFAIGGESKIYKTKRGAIKSAQKMLGDLLTEGASND